MVQNGQIMESDTWKFKAHKYFHKSFILDKLET